ncbi:MAG: beta-Ala-His dipeptidase [Firmicutes bacterium]|nr:beta-Ala-His dipeptidase [Bacillota bacterium]
MFEGWINQKAFEEFAWICSIPHGSSHEKALSDAILERARRLGYDAYQDQLYNLLIRIPASPDRVGDPALALQGHLDMVCDQAPGMDLDLLSEPVQLVIDGDYLRADGTTLGADDGVAIAYMLALMEDLPASHPELELMMTVSEETGMDGAAGFDYSRLNARRLINLDSEEEGTFIAGGAGGVTVHFEHVLDRTEIAGRMIPVEIVMDGLRGGHSGEDIHLGRGNANSLLGRFLMGWFNHCPDSRLDSLVGGSKANAIPRYARCRLWIPADSIKAIEEGVWWFGEDLAKEFVASDPKASIHLRYVDNPKVEGWFGLPVTQHDSWEVINFLQLCPTGVRSISKDLQGVVESSQNVAVMETEESMWKLSVSIRSNVQQLVSVMTDRIQLMAEMDNMDYWFGMAHPAWDYRQDSVLRSRMAAVYERMYGMLPQIRALHAGLECGVIQRAIPEMDIVSIGPNIQGIHTSGEKLEIASFGRVYEYLRDLITYLDN